MVTKTKETIQEFKPELGAQVRLKSGGPIMTVVEVTTNSLHPIDDKETIKCKWFAGSKISHARFAPFCLVEVKPVPEDQA